LPRPARPARAGALRSPGPPVVGGTEVALGTLEAAGKAAVGGVTRLVVVVGKGVVTGTVVAAGGGWVTGTVRLTR
jgi:hypothetical protein